MSLYVIMRNVWLFIIDFSVNWWCAKISKEFHESLSLQSFIFSYPIFDLVGCNHRVTHKRVSRFFFSFTCKLKPQVEMHISSETLEQELCSNVTFLHTIFACCYTYFSFHASFACNNFFCLIYFYLNSHSDAKSTVILNTKSNGISLVRKLPSVVKKLSQKYLIVFISTAIWF